MKYRSLNHKAFPLDKYQLEQYLEKLASDNVLKNMSSKDTYPIPKLKENFQIIEEVYHLLNEHIKIGIPIHPAGEWLLDNFYIIEEVVKTIKQDMTLKKYKQFLAIGNGPDRGFARIYVLAYEIVNFTDNHIDTKTVSLLLSSYQKKKMLTMDEIWNIGTFMQIALIQNVRDVCEKIYYSQMQKYRAENILERIVESKKDLKYKNLTEYKLKVKGYGEMKYPFVEHLSYRLRNQGKIAMPFINVLEEQVNKMGMTIDEIIKKEHFDIALKKVSMANCITSIKELLRMDFLTIFEQSNEIEEILRKDPANVYSKMDLKTKEQYRNAVQEIAKKTKIAEIYIAKKALDLALKGKEKQSHIGYYLISRGKVKLYEELQQPPLKELNNDTKARIYIYSIWIITLFIDLVYMVSIQNQINKTIITIILGILLLFPLQELVRQVIQYILGKIIKPKLIPKLDLSEGIPNDAATFVVIPTILKSKEKVEELMKKLEIYYLANKSSNIYFALLGDCSSGDNKEEKFDKEVIEEGLKQVERLNKKYNQELFYFIYRKRNWNGQEECFLGWERKRGLLNQFNEYLLGHIESPFLVNTIEKIPPKGQVAQKETSKVGTKMGIKYIITLDSDTELVLNSAQELIGGMEHILNKPVLNENEDLVIDGHALIQPRVQIKIEAANKSLFAKIFAGSGGVDSYTNAISDVYQDNFDEGIFTGKGIYNLEVFSKVLSNEIPENLVLSHDLLEGSYLRCGLASDIILIDGYPTGFLSFKQRLNRWTRGDFQIARWTKNKIVDKKENKKKNPLNILSRYKIMDNLFRGLTPIFNFFTIFILYILNILYNFEIGKILSIIIISILSPTILNIIERIVYRKEGQIYQKTFYPSINSFISSLIRGILTIMVLPDKVCNLTNAIVKTIYRLNFSKKHLLEWTTSEDADKLSKTDILSYYKNMIANVIFGLLGISYVALLPISIANLFLAFLSILWISGPFIFWKISKTNLKNIILNEISKKDKEYLYDVGKRTWQYFKDTLIENNNYLPPDNFQEDRMPNFVNRTSSTNIGLSFLCVIASYDMGYESLEDTLNLLNKMVITTKKLKKWNGHLYNWYNIETLEPLIPRYISSVDSGNFVGYVYVLKAFYEEIKDMLEKKILQNKNNDYEKEKFKSLLNLIPDWACMPIAKVKIANADFSKLYNSEKNLFSIGYNIEDNSLTPSYYDFLASEARQASFIAISKKDVPIKHWRYLSRTLTEMNGYTGLISWSGTAFEYLMPNIIMKDEKGSILDESCEFMLMEQKLYAKKLGLPWGFSETAFYLKDLNGNYQYKAVGIPWLGLKRGLEEDMVVASYASSLALTRKPKEVVQNLKRLEKEKMLQKYGFYEAIDYTPIRMPKGAKEMLVKTYMAHHQALILLSINNLFHDNIMQKRFLNNPEISAVNILLEETMPEKRIITKKEKIKPEKIVYKDYENFAQRIYKKTNNLLTACNVISSDKYSIIMDDRGNGYSKYKDYLVNKYNPVSSEKQGICVYIKNIENKKIWTLTNDFRNNLDKYEITFSEDLDKMIIENYGIESKLKVTIAPEKNIELRRLEIKNTLDKDQTLEVTIAFEPALCTLEQNIGHPAFQNLFLSYEYLEEDNIFIIKRKDRQNTKKGIFLAVSLYTDDKSMVGDLEYEIDKEKFQGRGNFNLPTMVEYSKPFSKKIQFVLDPILALRRTISLKKNEKIFLNFLMSIGESKEEVVNNLKEYNNTEKINKAFELSLAKADTVARYLGLKAIQIETYQKMLGYILFQNPLVSKEGFKEEYYEKDRLWKLGISGDLPILLVKIKNSNEIEILDEVIKAYEFFRLKNIEVDLVILNKEPNSYEKYTKDAIQSSISNANLGYMQNLRGGIFIIENEEEELLEFYAKLVIDAKKGPIDRQLKDLENEYIEKIKQIGEKNIQICDTENEESSLRCNFLQEQLLYQNEYGGFSKDGKQYLIIESKENRLPTVWSNIIANKNFGSIVTDSFGGFTFSKNSGLNKLTNWSNNQVIDEPSEVIYMQDEENLKSWSIGLNPKPDLQEYKIEYGFGYAIYKHESNQLQQNLTVFVGKEDSVKISLLEIKNMAPKKKKLNIIYYLRPVLGENAIKTNRYIDLEFKGNSNILLLKNKTNTDFREIIYLSSSEKIKSYTGNKNFFFENGDLSNPEALRKICLDNKNSIGKDSIVAMQIEVEIEAFSSKEISFVLGSETSIIDCQDKSYKYTNIESSKEELENVKNKWKNTLEKVQVFTPLTSFNILMNGWLIYQTISCRLYARSGFYQAGGAYGFRDQLQDTISLKYFDINFMKEQIIKHSKHQFIEGDVEHWWHEETKRGIRTHFSDDLLWLVYLTEEYIFFTGDYSILDIETNYVIGNNLQNGIDEEYDVHLESKVKETIFIHCERALKKALKFGDNGLPLIGSGDWNDGFSRVGIKGKGESVWLGFFLYDILKKWIKIKEEKIEKEIIEKNNNIIKEIDTVNRFKELSIEDLKRYAEKLKKALNENGWDGRWYRRAFMDDGNILGTLQNEECKIDGISQSWAVISDAGEYDKKQICMESLENHLIDRENGIIKLLDPPFEKSDLEPGYIKAYLPGTRENGGQYTHAAIWAIIAEACLGKGNKAIELFRMINPIEHARTKEEALKYKVEPYVVAADIYGQGNLAGRGGWTWYTGSSSWMYEAGLKYILGFYIEKGYLIMKPCIPTNWTDYKIHYKYGESIYNIFVKNPKGKNTGVEKVILNNEEIMDKKIKLIDNGKINEVEIIM